MDPYSVLGVSNCDSFETIKDAYRKLIISLHPDRNKSPNAANEFMTVQKAWIDITQNNEEYLRSIVSENVTFSSLASTTDETTPHFYRNCRCGDQIEIYLEDLLSGYNTFQCSSCSLSITITELPPDIASETR